MNFSLVIGCGKINTPATNNYFLKVNMETTDNFENVRLKNTVCEVNVFPKFFFIVNL